VIDGASRNICIVRVVTNRDARETKRESRVKGCEKGREQKEGTKGACRSD
jgi:hypothetical protein